MADEKKEEKSTPSETEAYLAERRAVTKPGQDKAMEASAKNEQTPETKKTEADPDWKEVLTELKGLREDNKKQAEFNEKLKGENFKLREKLRKLNDDDDDDGAKDKGKEADDEAFEKMATRFEERLMKKLSPMVHTVRKLDFGSQIGAIAASDPEIGDAINSLPPEIQRNLADRVEKVAAGMLEDGDDPAVATVNAIFYLAQRHGRRPSDSGLSLPDTKGAGGPVQETEGRKINRAVFGEHLIPMGRSAR